MIAVNLVTGFLGSGKTTLIRHLLGQRPEGESWAVLVNEFGEAGVDGALLDDSGVAIEEVAGGCLCCVAAPAFSVGLNRLIRQYRPDRILIEPSGLGHPAQILEQLRSPLYANILEVRAVLCVIDARQLSSKRHLEHPNFIDQIHLADVLVANKADLYASGDEQKFLEFSAKLRPPKSRLLVTQQGRIDAEVLDTGAQQRAARFPEAHAFLLAHSPKEASEGPANQVWTHYEGEADGYHRAGWLIDGRFRFDRSTLLEWLDRLPHERIKGIFLTREGGFSYNRAGTEIDIGPVEKNDTSRLQLIDSNAIDPAAIDIDLRRLALPPEPDRQDD